jgi:hypothetical protein
MIELSALRNLLLPFGGQLCIDVVVLAIPRSMLVAEVFVDLGVPHVIFFDFSEEFYASYATTSSA